MAKFDFQKTLYGSQSCIEKARLRMKRRMLDYAAVIADSATEQII